VTAEGPPDAQAAACAASGAAIAVICSSDARYTTDVVGVAPLLHAAGARVVVLAGSPGAGEAGYRAAGVDRFIFVKCDVLATLRELLHEAGVS
jgi:methylmalonyl-CoA mutase